MIRCLIAACVSLFLTVSQSHAQDLQKRIVVLTHSQIAALPTVPVEIVPAPGVGRAIELVQAYAVSNWYPIDQYSNISHEGFLTFALWYGDKEYQASDWGNISPFGNNINKPMWRFLPWLAVASDSTRALRLSANYIDNLPLLLRVTNGANGNFTGGHASNTLTVTVFYFLVDL